MTDARPLRILLVSQFWPSAGDPDLGVFVKQVVDELERRGHTVDRAVVDRRGAGRAGDVRLQLQSLQLVRHKPDVIFAHFLVPAGLGAALASYGRWPRRTPLVVMAHGQDVTNALHGSLVQRATAFVLRRAHTTIFNSAFLRDKLPLKARRSAVIDCGVDLDAFAPRDPADARAVLGLSDAEGPVFLFAGSLIERKNVVRLRDAFAAYGRGTLVVVGDGPLRGELEGTPGVRLVGRVPHTEMPRYMSAADVLVLPSLEEPLGQVVLEAMASERSVVATRVGGPAEFVTAEAGALVDPLDVEDLRAGLAHAAQLGTPNPAARRVAASHALPLQVDRMEQVLRDAAASAYARSRP